MLLDAFAPFEAVLQSAGRVGFLPPADLSISDHDLVLTMDLPGFTADELQIDVLNGELVVRGERKRPELAEGSRWAFTERTFGRFERRLQLPRAIDPDVITASMDNGVLSLIVPKREALKPKTSRSARAPSSVSSRPRRCDHRRRDWAVRARDSPPVPGGPPACRYAVASGGIEKGLTATAGGLSTQAENRTTRRTRADRAYGMRSGRREHARRPSPSSEGAPPVPRAAAGRRAHTTARPRRP
jgi:HSP20 family protein